MGKSSQLNFETEARILYKFVTLLLIDVPLEAIEYSIHKSIDMKKST